MTPTGRAPHQALRAASRTDHHTYWLRLADHSAHCHSVHRLRVLTADPSALLPTDRRPIQASRGCRPPRLLTAAYRPLGLLPFSSAVAGLQLPVVPPTCRRPSRGFSWLSITTSANCDPPTTWLRALISPAAGPQLPVLPPTDRRPTQASRGSRPLFHSSTPLTGLTQFAGLPRSSESASPSFPSTACDADHCIRVARTPTDLATAAPGAPARPLPRTRRKPPHRLTPPTTAHSTHPPPAALRQTTVFRTSARTRLNRATHPAIRPPSPTPFAAHQTNQSTPPHRRIPTAHPDSPNALPHNHSHPSATKHPAMATRTHQRRSS